MELTAEQIRVLGCLVEKEATTPDQYPLSSNALTVACNQKSSRDPAVDYPTPLVDQVMLDLRAAKLARTVHAAGQRTPKHKHVLDETWSLSPRQLAVLGVLMLRGPNTVRELRSRTERYIGFDSDGEVSAVLLSLASLDPPMAEEVGRAPGQRETRYQHLLADPALRSAETPGTPPPQTPPSQTSTPEAPSRHGAGREIAPSGGIDDLRVEVVELRAEVALLREQLERLSTSLGESPGNTVEGSAASRP